MTSPILTPHDTPRLPLDRGLADLRRHLRRANHVAPADPLGWLRAQPAFATIAIATDGPWLLFTYTAAATARPAPDWTPLDLVCRGIVTDRRGRVQALPFPKFFNWGALPEEQQATLTAHGIADVTEKLDGSLGILWHDDDRWRVTTRGSFTSLQARWATQVVQEPRYHLHELTPDYTLLVEIIHPANRIVVDYGPRAELVLLGVRDRVLETDLAAPAVRLVGELIGMPVAPRVDAGADTDLDGLLTHAQRLATGIEGWVVRFRDGTRVKIKTAEYLALHRLVTALSPARVREALLDNTLRDYLIALPPEAGLLAARYAQTIADAVAQREYATTAAYVTLTRVDTGGRAGRAAFARAVTAYCAALPPEQAWLQPALFFLLHDGKPLRPRLLRDLDLATLFPDQGAPGWSSWGATA